MSSKPRFTRMLSAEYRDSTIWWRHQPRNAMGYPAHDLNRCAVYRWDPSLHQWDVMRVGRGRHVEIVASWEKSTWVAEFPKACQGWEFVEVMDKTGEIQWRGSLFQEVK